MHDLPQPPRLSDVHHVPVTHPCVHARPFGSGVVHQQPAERAAAYGIGMFDVERPSGDRACAESPLSQVELESHASIFAQTTPRRADCIREHKVWPVSRGAKRRPGDCRTHDVRTSSRGSCALLRRPAGRTGYGKSGASCSASATSSQGGSGCGTMSSAPTVMTTVSLHVRPSGRPARMGVAMALCAARARR